jgi:hypothetical protein
MAAITSPGGLQHYVVTTVTFEDIAGLDGKQFGFQAGQPYAHLGLLIMAASVQANANLASSSGGVAIRSDVIYTSGFQNTLFLRFSAPQRAIGFYYRDSLAMSVRLVASDANGNMVEEDTFPGGEGYAGLIRPNAEIASLMIQAPHGTYEEADQSRTTIDDLSFARNPKILPGPLPGPPTEPGIVVVVVGAIGADGGGILIGPQGVIPVPPWNPAFQQVAAAANVLAAAERISDIPLREEVKRSASLLLKESIDRFFHGQ